MAPALAPPIPVQWPLKQQHAIRKCIFHSMHSGSCVPAPHRAANRIAICNYLHQNANDAPPTSGWSAIESGATLMHIAMLRSSHDRARALPGLPPPICKHRFRKPIAHPQCESLLSLSVCLCLSSSLSLQHPQLQSICPEQQPRFARNSDGATEYGQVRDGGWTEGGTEGGRRG